MDLFVIFVFGAVLLGAGAMLSPAYPTKQPRIALAATFSLAIIVGGTIFYASLFGWSTLVIDYLLFALVVGIFLGGTLSVGQARAEKLGENLPDAEQGWPGPQDLAFFVAIAAVISAPVFILPVPLGDAGSISGFMGLVVRDGNSFNTLAPFYPDVTYFHPPAFSALSAYFSQQLDQNLAITQFAIGAVLSFVNVWLAYDFGAELQSKRLGRAMSITMLLSMGLARTFIHGHFIQLMGLLFVQAFFIYSIRYTRYRYPVDVFLAGLMLGATLITDLTMTAIALLGFVPWLFTMWLGMPKPSRQTWGIMLLAIPVIMVISVSPWLIDSWGDMNIVSLERRIDNLEIFIFNHGFWMMPAVVLGLWLGWQTRNPVVILAFGWLVFLLDFSVTGGIAGLMPFVDAYINPLSLAWHGPIVPFTILAAIGLLWLWDQYIVPVTGALTYRQTYIISTLVIILTLIVVGIGDRLYTPIKTIANLPPMLASDADVAAMDWLHDETAQEAHILNFPIESDWAAVITERKTVYLPSTSTINHTLSAVTTDAQTTLQDFWKDPINQRDLLIIYEIDYVLVPQLLTSSYQWHDKPLEWAFETISAIEELDILQLVFEQDGAQVYQVIKP